MVPRLAPSVSCILAQLLFHVEAHLFVQTNYVPDTTFNGLFLKLSPCNATYCGSYFYCNYYSPEDGSYCIFGQVNGYSVSASYTGYVKSYATDCPTNLPAPVDTGVLARYPCLRCLEPNMAVPITNITEAFPILQYNSMMLDNSQRFIRLDFTGEANSWKACNSTIISYLQATKVVLEYMDNTKETFDLPHTFSCTDSMYYDATNGKMLASNNFY